MAHSTKRNKRQSTGLNNDDNVGSKGVASPLQPSRSAEKQNSAALAQISSSSLSSSLLSSSSLGVAERGRVSSSEKSKRKSRRQKRQGGGTQGGDGGNVAAKKKRRTARSVDNTANSNSKLNNNASLSSTPIAAASSLPSPPPSPLSPPSSSTESNNDGANNNDNDSSQSLSHHDSELIIDGLDVSSLLSILDKVTVEEAADLIKICGAEIRFERIGKSLVRQKEHLNPTYTTMSTQLRASVAYRLGKITKKQEEWITRQCREEHRLECERNGHIFNGGEMAEEGNLDGIKALTHYQPETENMLVGNDKCCRVPRKGPGSDCIIMLTVTFPKSCYYEKELQDNPDAEWPQETSDDVKNLAAGMVVTDIWPSELPKGDSTAKALKKAKKKFVDDMGFDDPLDGKKVKATDIAEMMGQLQHIRQIVAMSKHTGKPVPTLAFGAVARDSLADNGRFQSDCVLGCGASHHMEGIMKACSRNEENIAESDSNMGTWYGHGGNNGEAFPMTFGMRRYEKKYLNGEVLDIHVLLAEAAMYMFKQTQHFGRTREEVLEAMPDELSVHHYLIYEPCVRVGKMRTEAALFMVEQIYINGLSQEAALDLMRTKLSPQHRAIYEGCLKGRPVRLTSLDGKTVLATTRSCRAAARMLDISDFTIRDHLQDGVLTYFGEELCLIEEIKGEEVDKIGKTSAFDPWFSTLQLEKKEDGKPVRLTSLDGKTVLATTRSIRAAAGMLGICADTIRNHLHGGVLTYFGEELCLIKEIKGEEVDKIGKTSAFDPWFSTLQLEKIQLEKKEDGKPVRLTSLDGKTVLATTRSIRAAARTLDISNDTIHNHLYDGVLKYFGQELCLIKEIKGEEVDEFGKTSAFDPWFSTLQLEKIQLEKKEESEVDEFVKTQYKPADTRNKMFSIAKQLEDMFIQAELLQYGDNKGCSLLIQPLLSEKHVNILLAQRSRYNRPNHPPAQKTWVHIGEEMGATIGESVGAQIASTLGAHVSDEVGICFGKKFGADFGAAVGAQVAAEAKAKAFDGAKITAELLNKVQSAVVAEVKPKVIAAIQVGLQFQYMNKP